jgi:hypothetical protein
MIKQTITYVNLDGDEVTEDFHFHLSTPRLIRMTDADPDLVAKLEGVANSGNAPLIIDTFSEIICEAFGVRDGKAFRQSDDLSEEFRNSMAFDTLLLQLLTDAQLAGKFINGIMPADLVARGAQMQAAAQPVKADLLPDVFTGGIFDTASGLRQPRDREGQLLPWAFRKPTDNEVRSMTKDQLRDVSVRTSSDWAPPA